METIISLKGNINKVAHALQNIARANNGLTLAEYQKRVIELRKELKTEIELEFTQLDNVSNRMSY